ADDVGGAKRHVVRGLEGWFLLALRALVRQAEAADAAGLLLGKEGFERVVAEKGVAGANVDPAARQGRPGPHWPKSDLFEYLSAGRVQGDELAAADGGEVRHAVADRDPRGDEISDVREERRFGCPAHRGNPRAIIPPALGVQVEGG